MQLPLTTTSVLPAVPARVAAARSRHPVAALGALDCILVRVEQGAVSAAGRRQRRPLIKRGLIRPREGGAGSVLLGRGPTENAVRT